MKELMRCLYCGLLQDEPSGVKQCLRCGGELAFEETKAAGKTGYLQTQMELDQINAPAGTLTDRYLIVSLKTPASLPAEYLPGTPASRPPFNLAAVLDTSGSMRGPKFEHAMQAVNQALLSLFPGDSFALIRFDEEAQIVIEATKITPSSAKTIHAKLANIQPGGSTALHAGLALGFEQALKFAGQSNLILLLSDGHANIGETGIEEIGRLAWQARKKNITVSTLGIGADYNEALMVEIATQGAGRYYHVLHASEITPTLKGELGESASAAARKVEIGLHLPEGALAMPISPMYPARQKGRKAIISAGDLPLDIELEIPVRITLPANEEGTKASIEGQVDYETPVGQALTSQLNRVGIRFLSNRQYQLRDGVVSPVAERVLDQLRDVHILNRARLYASNQPDAMEQDERSRETLRAYASRLGKELYQQNEAVIQERLDFMASSPTAAKFVANESFSKLRKTRKFDQS